MSEIKKAVVIGAGVMGAGIAAHFANAGIEVELLDIVPKDASDRDVIAKSAIAKMAKSKPAMLMHKRNAKLIRAGNIDDHLDRIKDADIIIEAVIENPKIKSDLFKKIDKFKKADAIVGSNTSTIPLKDLMDGQSDKFKETFMITHFFNPPRYMPLLELVTSEHNKPETVAKVTEFMDKKMGKGVINCSDTPGFIANRIGTFWIEAAMRQTVEKGLSVEEADAILGRPMGVPKTGVFALVDMVGLDLIPHIQKSLLAKLDKDDEYLSVQQDYPVVKKLIEEGYTGRKGKGGFYRLNDKREKEYVDLQTGAYSLAKRPKPDALKASKKEGLRGLVTHDSKHGEFAWEVFKQTMLYTISHAEEVAGSINDIDEAMKLGYNWNLGPFEMVDKIGVDWFIEKLEAEGTKLPKLLEAVRGKSFYKVENGKLNQMNNDGSGYSEIKRPEGVLLLSDIKRASKPVFETPKFLQKQGMGAAIWDIGDGVLCFEFKSKSNVIDPLIMRALRKTIKTIESDSNEYKALVIHNEGDNFSLGANLQLAEYAHNLKQTWLIDKIVKQGQEVYQELKQSKFPVVSAPRGMALGGGCEILLHSDAVQAHAESYIGLVEVGVGLIPGWGGCKEMLSRAYNNKKRAGGPMPAVAETFEKIGTAKVATSAEEAKSMLFLNEKSSISMNRSRLLADAKKKALDMVDGYTPPEPKPLILPGKSGRSALNMAVDGFFSAGMATPYDVVLMDRLAEILTGGDKGDITVEMSEQDILDLELKIFKDLVRDDRTIARIKHILKTNKPLREKPVKGMTTNKLRKEARGNIVNFDVFSAQKDRKLGDKSISSEFSDNKKTDDKTCSNNNKKDQKKDKGLNK